jgi:hypothetical protein
MTRESTILAALVKDKNKYRFGDHDFIHRKLPPLAENHRFIRWRWTYTLKMSKFSRIGKQELRESPAFASLHF